MLFSCPVMCLDLVLERSHSFLFQSLEFKGLWKRQLSKAVACIWSIMHASQANINTVAPHPFPELFIFIVQWTILGVESSRSGATTMHGALFLHGLVQLPHPAGFPGPSLKPVLAVHQNGDRDVVLATSEWILCAPHRRDIVLWAGEQSPADPTPPTAKETLKQTVPSVPSWFRPLRSVSENGERMRLRLWSFCIVTRLVWQFYVVSRLRLLTQSRGWGCDSFTKSRVWGCDSFAWSRGWCDSFT